jgi:diphthamide biosynthesis enzyme Dph1/Dph2-like protein
MADIESEYELELERAVSLVRKEKAKLVCIQLPDGLKPVADKIAERIESETKAKCLIWLGSCFGACDVPNLGKLKPKIDLLIQFGHSEI